MRQYPPLLPLVTVSYRLPPAILLPAYAVNMANRMVLQADRVEKRKQTVTDGFLPDVQLDVFLKLKMR